jgi:hypothetical protein
MDALKIAFETIIVGALALPWMLLVVDLFSPAKEQLLDTLLDTIKNQTVAAVAGALLFAMAYLVGSSVARLAEDFFNDEDLHTKFTEDEIRTAVYCKPTDPWLIQRGITLVDDNGGQIPAAQICSGDSENNVRQAFAVQESALMVAGPDKTDKLRYLHQQIVVLRGAALDGLITTLLCLFAYAVMHGRWGRTAVVVFCLGIVGWAMFASVRHVHDHWHNLAAEPPLMEGLLLTIAAAGLCIAWKGCTARSYGWGLIFSALLTALAFAGWWSSEVLYDHTIIYFFYAQSHGMPGVGR